MRLARKVQLFLQVLKQRRTDMVLLKLFVLAASGVFAAGLVGGEIAGLLWMETDPSSQANQSKPLAKSEKGFTDYW